MSERLPSPAVFVADGCVIDLLDVSTVICGIEAASSGHVVVCRVILKSGASFVVDAQFSNSLIHAVAWSRSPASVAKPKDGAPDQGELAGNSWSSFNRS